MECWIFDDFSYLSTVLPFMSMPPSHRQIKLLLFSGLHLPRFLEYYFGTVELFLESLLQSQTGQETQDGKRQKDIRPES